MFKPNTQLFTYYGGEYGNALRQKKEFDDKVKDRKERLLKDYKCKQN